MRFDMQSGDLLRIDGTGSTDQIALLAFGADGVRCERRLSLGAIQDLEPNAFEAAPLLGWITAQGGESAEALRAVRLGPLNDAFVLRAPSAVHIWVVFLNSREALIHGTSGGAVTGSHQFGTGNLDLPPPLGDIREEFTVDRGTALSYVLRKGETVQVIDVHGQQCSDFQALRLDGLDIGQERMIDSTATRSMVRRAYPSVQVLTFAFGPEPPGV
ncbi:MAG: DUF1989 domain-containing protein [Paracoccaceae bacterium]